MGGRPMSRVMPGPPGAAARGARCRSWPLQVRPAPRRASRRSPRRCAAARAGGSRPAAGPPHARPPSRRATAAGCQAHRSPAPERPAAVRSPGGGSAAPCRRWTRHRSPVRSRARRRSAPAPGCR